MREEKFKMERQGLIQVGDKVKISEFLSATNYSYIIEPAVAMCPAAIRMQTVSNPQKESSKVSNILPVALL